MLHKTNKRNFFIILIGCALFSSCISYKEVPYFRDLPPEPEISETISNYSPLLIQKNDVLNITINSLNPEASNIFNPPATLPSSGTGITVDQNGDIQLPYVGKIRVAGLTSQQAKALITEKILYYLKEPVVRLQLTNFKIAVFGGVSTPGIFQISNERITLTEALIMAGDLEMSARRHNVLLVREIDGKRQFVRFDMGSKSTFTSPYFYLKSNDLIYVEPGTSREKRENIVGNASLLFSVATLIALLLRY